MRSQVLHVIKLICAVWPIALNSKDFVDPKLMDEA